MVKVVIIIVKVFVKVPSLVYFVDDCQPYHICPSAPADGGVNMKLVQMDITINNRNVGVPLLGGKG